jgi:hypothetical protein
MTGSCPWIALYDLVFREILNYIKFTVACERIESGGSHASALHRDQIFRSVIKLWRLNASHIIT